MAGVNRGRDSEVLNRWMETRRLLSVAVRNWDLFIEQEEH